MQYVSALVAYDGSAYHGFQYQANAATIQCELEAALDRVAKRDGRVAGAGRTDAGVHASGQVIAVYVHWQHQSAGVAASLERLPAGCDHGAQGAGGAGGVSPPLQRCQPHVPLYGLARSRRCRGSAELAPRRSPLTDRFALYEVRSLNLAAMQEAALGLVGSHDFATFGQPPQGESTVRTVHAAEWQVVEENLPQLGDYPSRRLVFTITANAFLRQMVRSIVGSLLAVGRGEWAVSDFASALAGS